MGLTINLSPDQEAALRAAAAEQSLTPQQLLQRLVEGLLPAQTGEPHEPDAQGPLADKIRALWADMPAEVRAEFPEGGSRRIDHHVYGLSER